MVEYTGNEQKAMAKQLILTATLLLIHNNPKAIHCVCAILDFMMLAHYMLYNDKTLAYMKYILYKLEKTKMVFEKYYPINTQLLWPVFYYSMFHDISYFVECIQKYGSEVNYHTAHSEEAAYKYFLKAFYGWTNKKEYESQIL